MRRVLINAQRTECNIPIVDSAEYGLPTKTRSIYMFQYIWKTNAKYLNLHIDFCLCRIWKQYVKSFLLVTEKTLLDTSAGLLLLPPVDSIVRKNAEWAQIQHSHWRIKFPNIIINISLSIYVPPSACWTNYFGCASSKSHAHIATQLQKTHEMCHVEPPTHPILCVTCVPTVTRSVLFRH